MRHHRSSNKTLLPPIPFRSGPRFRTCIRAIPDPCPAQSASGFRMRRQGPPYAGALMHEPCHLKPCHGTTRDCVAQKSLKMHYVATWRRETMAPGHSSGGPPGRICQTQGKLPRQRLTSGTKKHRWQARVQPPPVFSRLTPGIKDTRSETQTSCRTEGRKGCSPARQRSH